MMQSSHLNLLNKTYQQYGQKLGWQLDTLRTEPQHDGSFHVEIDEDGYHWVVTERGLELERHIFDSDEHILEHIFIHLSFWAGVEFELKHRDETEDGRRKIFAHQLQLLKKLNNNWAMTAEKQIAAILEQHPYRDSF